MHTNSITDRQTDRQIDRQIDRQTDRQTDRTTATHIKKVPTKRAMNSKATRPPPVPESTCAPATNRNSCVCVRERK